MLDGGDHYDDFPYMSRRNLERIFNRDTSVPHPREKCMQQLDMLGIVNSPQPMGSKIAN